MSKDRGNYIRTFTSKKFYHNDPKSKDICIEDIAHSLSLLCRFAGHVKEFYSVGQHSLLVSELCPPEDALWGLMHDASEAYCVDIPRPLKHSLGMEAYRHIEHNVMKAIAKKFRLAKEEPLSVKQADAILLVTEQRDLMLGGKMSDRGVNPLSYKIHPLPSKEVEYLFLKRFKELKGK